MASIRLQESNKGVDMPRSVRHSPGICRGTLNEDGNVMITVIRFWMLIDTSSIFTGEEVHVIVGRESSASSPTLSSTSPLYLDL